ncbi:MAG TPA: hypothetical protein VKM55_06045 [Candidatus Lokiarchaeia archaeon]|nr:hypothetical protein [Candidatus Lokiarchaeia archaeon]
MELEETDEVNDEAFPYMTVDADLYLKDIVSVKKPRHVDFEVGK